MTHFNITRAVNDNFIDFSTDININDVVPERGLDQILDIAFDEVITKAKQKKSVFKFQIVCQAEFKVIQSYI